MIIIRFAGQQSDYMDKNTQKSIIELIERGEPLPLEYEGELFPTTKREYELKYAEKEREETILNDTMSVPFQAVKHFGNVRNSEWANMLIFGDNLQALKHLLKLKEEGKLKNPDGKDGVKLVYIDPPFATKQDFKGGQEQKAYGDSIEGAKFIEFIRKRLILLREVMTEDGMIFVHLDNKKAHYIKIIMDEVFSETNFRNDIIWRYNGKGLTNTQTSFVPYYADILFYSKSNKTNVFSNRIPGIAKSVVERFGRYMDSNNNILFKTLKKYNENTEYEKAYARFKKEFGREPKDDDIAVDYNSGIMLKDIWDDIAIIRESYAYDEYYGYPTPKPEKLVERIISAASAPGDIVLDCFAGSGTTGAVAEKLYVKGINRKWIMIDCSKFAIYTITKRLLNLKEEIGNKGKSLKHMPFVLYNSGLYNDGELLQQMQSEDYKDFVLELFSCQKREHKINGLQMQGTLNNHSVMIFDKANFLTYEFIDDLHKIVGSSIKDQLYLIAPVGVVGFNEDYVMRGKIKYVVLRVPNSIIEHIRDRNFTKLKQPRSIDDINQTIDAVGFDFVYPPNVKTKYYLEKLKGKLIEREYILEIIEFEPVQLGTNVVKFKDPRAESLAMVMVDFNYDGETFNLSKYFFGDKIAKDGFRATWNEEIGDKIMVIYVDIFGNEKREVISKKNFERG